MRYLVLIFVIILQCAAPAYVHAKTQQKRIALTFDDIPRERGAFLTPDERTERLISALKSAKVKQAAFFLNPAKLNDPDGIGGEARIAAYVAAGHVIANHSNMHISLNANSAEVFLADIDAAQIWLKDRPGYRPWFRFPYLHEGGADKIKRDAVRMGLKERGLSNGYVTADGNDWHLESLTLMAKEQGKPMDMKQLRRLYVSAQMSGIEYHDQLARDTLGRSPAHVLLLHETDLAALFLPDLITEMRKHGWQIISADDAFADPINQAMPDVPFASGTLIGSMAWGKDVQPPAWPIWINTATQTLLFETRVIKDKLTMPEVSK